MTSRDPGIVGSVPEAVGPGRRNEHTSECFPTYVIDIDVDVDLVVRPSDEKPGDTGSMERDPEETPESTYALIPWLLTLTSR